MLLMITSTGKKLLDLLTSITLNDLKSLPPQKKGGLVNFSQFLDAAHILTLNCDKLAGDRPKQLTYKIFSIKGRF